MNSRKVSGCSRSSLRPHAVEGQHPVDREVGAHVPEQRDVAERVEPVGIVDQQRVGGAVAEGEEAVERAPDARLVGGDGVLAQERPRLVAAARVADLRGSAAEQHDRPVAGLLEPAQHHDLHQAAHVQAVGGAVEADIGAEPPACGQRVQRVVVGALVDEAALRQHAHEIGGEHRRSTCWLSFRPAAPARGARARGHVSQPRRSDNAAPRPALGPGA